MKISEKILSHSNAPEKGPKTYDNKQTGVKLTAHVAGHGTVLLSIHFGPSIRTDMTSLVQYGTVGRDICAGCKNGVKPSDEQTFCMKLIKIVFSLLIKTSVIKLLLSFPNTFDTLASDCF